MKKLYKGELAPNFEYQSFLNKKNIFFFDEKTNKKCVIYFLRYVGCLICQLDMKYINDNLVRYKNKNSDVYVVIQSSNTEIDLYNKTHKINFEIISDPFSNIYDKYGVKKGGYFKFLNPRSLIKVFKSLKFGFRHGKFEGNETQLPAVFIIDENHRINYSYYGNNIGDLPSIDDIINKL